MRHPHLRSDAQKAIGNLVVVALIILAQHSFRLALFQSSTSDGFPFGWLRTIAVYIERKVDPHSYNSPVEFLIEWFVLNLAAGVAASISVDSKRPFRWVLAIPAIWQLTHLWALIGDTDNGINGRLYYMVTSSEILGAVIGGWCGRLFQRSADYSLASVRRLVRRAAGASQGSSTTHAPGED
jgi:hypothetical protein